MERPHVHGHRPQRTLGFDLQGIGRGHEDAAQECREVYRGEGQVADGSRAEQAAAGCGRVRHTAEPITPMRARTYGQETTTVRALPKLLVPSPRCTPPVL